MNSKQASVYTVCVFCGSSPGTVSEFSLAAQTVGEEIAARGWNLVFGGGDSGLMHVVSQAALSCGASVTGIIPKFLTAKEPPSGTLTELIYVDDMSERKQRMIEKADFFVVLPGGVGTLDESFEVMTGNQLGLFHKPIGFLSTCAYYDQLRGFMEHARETGLVSRQFDTFCFFDSDPDALLNKLTGALAAKSEGR